MWKVNIYTRLMGNRKLTRFPSLPIWCLCNIWLTRCLSSLYSSTHFFCIKPTFTSWSLVSCNFSRRLAKGLLTLSFNFEVSDPPSAGAAVDISKGLLGECCIWILLVNLHVGSKQRLSSIDVEDIPDIQTFHFLYATDKCFRIQPGIQWVTWR